MLVAKQSRKRVKLLQLNLRSDATLRESGLLGSIIGVFKDRCSRGGGGEQPPLYTFRRK